MEVKGYKCFNKGLINNYGKKFSIGQIYIASGIIKFGLKGNGFHMCKNIEDTFRYFDTSNKDICVCEVIGSGNLIEYEDEYNGYFNIYSVEKLKIVRELSRLELIEEGLKLNESRAKRFVSTIELTEEEIILFKNKFKNKINVMDAIAYYQEGDKEVYDKKILKYIDKKIYFNYNKLHKSEVLINIGVKYE